MKYVLLILVIFSLVACESSDDDTYAKAQACLNSAVGTEADQCKAMVAGMGTQQAYIISCSADFIDQGFTASAMANAFQQLKNNSSSSSALSMMSFITFDSQSHADTAVADCQNTGVESFGLFASLCDVSTMAAFAGGYNGVPNRVSGIDSTEITSGIASLNGSASDQAAVGNLVNIAYNSACKSAAYSGSQLCTQVVNAVNTGGSNQTVGQNFLTSLQ